MHRTRLWGLIVIIMLLAVTACTPAGQQDAAQPTAAGPSAATPTASAAEPTVAPATPTTPTVTPAATQAATSAPAIPTPTQGSAPAAEAAIEPSVSQAAPTPLKLGVTRGKLQGGEGWFVVELPDGAVLTLALTPDKAAETMRLTVYAPSQDDAAGLEAAPGVQASLKLRMNTSSGGKYAVQLIGQGEFTLEAAITPQNDAKANQDAADVVDKAAKLPLGANYSGQVGDYDEQDFFAFDVKAGQVLQVSFRALEDSDEPTVQLLSPKGGEEWGAYGVRRGDVESTRLVLGAESGGEYALTVQGTGSYTFTVRASEQNDGDSGADAGDEVGDAVTVQPGKIIMGELGSWDLSDWYTLALKGGQMVSLKASLVKGGEAVNIHLLDEDESELAAEYGIAPGRSTTLTYMLDDTAQGDYFIWVEQGVGLYTIEIKAESQNDADTGGDAGGEIDSAAEIEVGGPYPGILGGDDAEDYYAFAPAEGQEIHFTPAKGCEAVNFFVLDADGEEVWAEWDATPAETVSTTLEGVDSEPYYLHVSGGPCSYTFGIAE